MSFLISPGIRVREIDLTTIVPQVATSIGAVAGVFNWGPLNEVLTIDNEDQLVKICGKPNNDTANSFFTAANFLAYSNSLRVVRVADEAVALNSTADGAGLLVRNDSEYDAQYADGSAGVGSWVSKFPGVLGDSLKVSICAGSDAFSQGFAITTLGDKLVGDTSVLSDLLDQITVGSVFRASNGQTRKIVSINSALSEALETSGTAITGVGTSFETTLQVGTILESGGEIRHVVAVTDDENATLNASFTVDIVAPTAIDSALITLENAFSSNLTSNAGLLRWEFADVFGTAPTTSDFASSEGSLNDEMHVVVVDVDGRFSNIRNGILERYNFVSKASNAKTFDGASNYYVDVINRRSQFIRWTDHMLGGANFGTPTSSGLEYDLPSSPETVTLSGGADGSTVTNADLIRGYDLYSDSEVIDVSLIMAGDAPLSVQIHLINQIAERRQDCIVLLSPPASAVVNNVNNEVTDILNHRDGLPSSSYAVLDSGWKRQYDKYNDIIRTVPLNGDIAGLCARTDYEADAWFSPAGFNRGNIKSVEGLAFSPNESQRNDLYVQGVNSVVSFRGLGTVLYGDKTLLAKPSAFDRINVRRLFNILKKSIRRASQFSLFEFNDTFTRNQFRNLVEPFLRDVQGRRGITEFRVVCDESNNTPEVIDTNQFIADIYVRPARSINFITLNFIAVRTGVEFTEVVGRF